jgi:hypothetical protein
MVELPKSPPIRSAIALLVFRHMGVNIVTIIVGSIILVSPFSA